MSEALQFDHSFAFDPSQAEALLRAVPAECGVFVLHGARPADQPYMARTANLRRRLLRLLAPLDSQSKRLNLRDKVARVEYAVTGSEFESNLLLYRVYTEVFGAAEARKRLRLYPPFFIRFAAENAYPRAYVTNRISRRALECCYGPFPSRAAAERYLDEALNLFKLRRCHEELKPDPVFPGCVYSEMKMCLAPCFKGCTDERYAAEAHAVREFLETRSASLLAQVAAERDRASGAMDFEQAAALHARWQKVKETAQLADEIVRPLPQVNGLIVMPAAGKQGTTPDVALFLVRGGSISGPARFSTIGMRHANEQSGSTSLFVQPLAVEAVPLVEDGAVGESGAAAESVPVEGVEDRLRRTIDTLGAQRVSAKSGAELADHLSLLKRWYYRPQKQRVGEMWLEDGNGKSARGQERHVLKLISRVWLGVRGSRAPHGVGRGESLEDAELPRS